MKKEEEIKQLENYYNCLADYQDKKRTLIISKKELEEVSQADPLADFDKVQLEQYILDKAGAEPKKAFFNIGKKKIAYESAMQQWSTKVEDAKVSYYDDKKEERESIKKNYETELKAKKKLVEKFEAEFKESGEKLKKADLDLGDDFTSLIDTEKLLKILKSKRADSLKEALNIFYLGKQIDEIGKTLEMQEAEIRETNLLATDAMTKAKESFELAESASRRADDAYRLADDAYSEARSVRSAIEG